MNKKLTKSLLALLLCAGTAAQAAVVVVNTPGVTLTAGQPIQAVFMDANGNSYQQQVYYNPTAGGIDIGNNSAYTSVYFPVLGTGYLAYNGFWVGEDGYYWNNGRRLYVGPSWHDHYHGYWSNHWHGGGGNHYDVHVNEFHGGGDWHGGGHNDWHGGGGWHGGGHEDGHEGGGGHRR